ncbi:sugar transferase [Corynebacterium glutamicum]|uniref:sugar transferase n=1 Tax=Corynebacterium glutamicum TaxID=1718 RepID=UPI003B639F34
MQAKLKIYDFVKRMMDIAVSGAGLIISAPIQLTTAVVILMTHGRPILFRQRRPGKNGVVFEMIKFRTMLEPDSTHITDADRLTKTGKFLRATSLDELPSLWNVFKGDMSIVGPRPLLVEYLNHYSPEQARRHEVRPGITGLAQVSGRNSISWDERFKLDVDYVDHRNLKLDFKILIDTVCAVFRRQGISHEGHATMPKFSEE